MFIWVIRNIANVLDAILETRSYLKNKFLDIPRMMRVLRELWRRPLIPTTARTERPSRHGQTADHDDAVRFPIV